MAEFAEVLKKYNQQHLLTFLDELPAAEQQALLEDIESIDFAECRSIYNTVLSRADADLTQSARFFPPAIREWKADGTFTTSVATSGAGDEGIAFLTRLNSTPQVVTEKWWNTGLRYLAEGKVAVVIMAGGQGTRLGWDKPKGAYPIGPVSNHTFFQIFSERLIRVRQLAVDAFPYVNEVPNVPLYVMTSDHNHSETVTVFKDNNYFGLNAADVHFFGQKTVPCLTKDGHAMLETKSRVARNPNGNGGLFEALEGTGMLADMKARGIEGIHVHGVDNVLVKGADPLFIGYVVDSGADIGNKCTKKENPHEKIGMFCSKATRGPNNSYSKRECCVVEYSELPAAMRDKRCDDSNELAFSAGNICNHFFLLSFVERLLKEHLMQTMYAYHMAEKKIPYVDIETGKTITPTTANGIKLEYFIFDSFAFANCVAGLEADRSAEFAPVKNATGEDSPESAKTMMSDLHKSWVQANGQELSGEGYLEISPLVSYAGEGLEELPSHRQLPFFLKPS